MRDEDKDPGPHGAPTTRVSRGLDEHDVSREEVAQLREELLRVGRDAEVARTDREQLIGQMRDANEQLLLATLRADELMEVATVARSQAQAASRAKDEFIAMLGHELRNPLAPILSALELVAMRDAPCGFERERGIIERQVKHLVRLVDDLLNVSRLNEGKFELRREPVDIADVVRDAAELASPFLQRKAQRLSLDVEPKGLAVYGDVMRLAQAVGNVLINAATFTPKDGAVTVTAERRGLNVCLFIRDTGIGISPQMLPRVFDSFAQERQALDRPQGGLGLGLAIVRNIVEMHGGSVVARSDGLGHGSEFAIELPAL